MHAGFRVKPSKCDFAEEKIGLCSCQKDCVLHNCFPRPTTVKEVKRFLRSANFYRRHTKNMGL